MPTNSDTWQEYAGFAVAIGRIAHSLEVDTRQFTKCGKFVGQGNIDVPVQHAEELGHFSCFERTDIVGRRAEILAIKIAGPLGRRFVQAPNDLGGGFEPLHDEVGLDSFWAVSHGKIFASLQATEFFEYWNKV